MPLRAMASAIRQAGLSAPALPERCVRPGGTNPPRAVCLFSGAGGMDLGLEAAGFAVSAANEFWAPAQRTYACNFHATTLVSGDIARGETQRQIRDATPEGCDLVAGGFPCQTFSSSGLRLPGDPRGKLFEALVQVVSMLRPAVVVLENVKGILSMRHPKPSLSKAERNRWTQIERMLRRRSELRLLRRQARNNPRKFNYREHERCELNRVQTWIECHREQLEHLTVPVVERIEDAFRAIGYNLKHKVLDAAAYGAPQHRERVIFIGVRDGTGLKIGFPEPTHGPGRRHPYVTVRQVIDDLKDAPENVALSHVYTSHAPAFVARLRRVPVGGNLYPNFSDSWHRQEPNEPARTVKGNHGCSAIHYARDRAITTREQARLQSFPDCFRFLGSRTDQATQIGNAVPPPLAKAVGLSVLSFLPLRPTCPRPIEQRILAVHCEAINGLREIATKNRRKRLTHGVGAPSCVETEAGGSQ